jgi:hypothetical protein
MSTLGRSRRFGRPPATSDHLRQTDIARPARKLTTCRASPRMKRCGPMASLSIRARPWIRRSMVASGLNWHLTRAAR